MILIRPASERDIPEISRVHMQTWRTAYRGILTDSFLANLSYEKHVQRHQRLMAQPGVFYFVVESPPSGIDGFLMGGPGRSKELPYRGELYAIYILEEFSRQGIGTAFWQKWAETLRESQMNSAYVWVLADNARAIAFYQKLGGRFIGEQTIKLGEQSLLESAYAWDDLGIASKT